MLVPYPHFGKLPTYNFVIEMTAPSEHLHKFAGQQPRPKGRGLQKPS